MRIDFAVETPTLATLAVAGAEEGRAAGVRGRGRGSGSSVSVSGSTATTAAVAVDTGTYISATPPEVNGFSDAPCPSADQSQPTKLLPGLGGAQKQEEAQAVVVPIPCVPEAQRVERSSDIEALVSTIRDAQTDVSLVREKIWVTGGGAFQLTV